MRWLSALRPRAFCVAIVGADGSGKTSVARRILADSPLPMRYVYLGPAIGSANYALPTSRLLNYLKRRAVKDLLSEGESLPPRELMNEDMQRRIPTRGSLLKAVGLVNRIAEEWYRQLIVWIFRMRGFVVLCDRHFLFEYCPNSPSRMTSDPRLSVRIHRWLLKSWYPRPSLVVHLYAAPEILHRRTPEWTLEYLAWQQQGIRDQGKTAPRFVEVDASQPFEAVVAAVQTEIDYVYGVTPGALA